MNMNGNVSHKPSVSVVMPVLNAENYIAESIKSILDQTFSDFEFIIIDDGSSDNSWRIIKEYSKKDKRIILLRNSTNLRICETLNRGLKLAKGKYIARMDADDWCYPDRLEKQYKFMEGHPEVIICGGAMEVCDSQMQTLGVRNYNLTDENIRKYIFWYSPFCHASTIYQTKLAKIVQYNKHLYDSEDYDFYFRMGEYGKFANLSDIVYRMRVNINGVSLLRSRRQERIVLYIRLKAIFEYGYRMQRFDKLYLFLQLMSYFLVPAPIKFFIYNLARNRWRKDLNKSAVNILPQIPFWGPISYFKAFVFNRMKKK